MKKQDLLFICCLAALFLPFFLSDTIYQAYKDLNASHGMFLSFLKFAILSTAGEMLGARISTGKYYSREFGLFAKMIVWGILGMGINMAMIIFSNGVPAFLNYMGMTDAFAALSGPLSFAKIFVAFSISVAMNSIFAPVFMTLHKISDIHIADHNGSTLALIKPWKWGAISNRIDWQRQWSFVFLKTIPIFWFPAHTITFLLPSEMRVLFAALLGVVLGVFMAIAAANRDKR